MVQTTTLIFVIMNGEDTSTNQFTESLLSTFLVINISPRENMPLVVS